MSSGNKNSLDYLRRTHGYDVFRNYFHVTAEYDRQKAVNLINNDDLQFSSFYMLLPEIREFALQNELSLRNITTIWICADILGGGIPQYICGDTKFDYDGTAKDTLLWIFNTGISADGFSNKYDHILDITAAILIKTYSEKSILQAVAHLIFRRNRQDRYFHELVWAFFSSRDTSSLKLIAKRLQSSEKDARLARSLLHIKSNECPPRQYSSYLTWLNENNPYLYFTGESLNMTNSPTPCKVDLAAKYLCKSISPETHTPEVPLTDSESNCLSCFKNADDQTKAKLSGFSHAMHKKSRSYWNKWIEFPIEKQIKIAENSLGEFV